MTLRARERTVSFPRPPLVMGIVNVNDDSFSGDGTLNQRDALATARLHASHGADIIDVGAESARTNRDAISVDEEIKRLTPFINEFDDALRGASPVDDQQLWPPLLSINTWRAGVVQELLPRGIDFLNDMGGLPDPSNAKVCVETGAALLIMHTVAEPKIPQVERTWEHAGGIVEAVNRFFEEKRLLAESAGLDPEQIVLDPGIDFAKQKDDSLRILAHLDEFRRHGRPLLAPISRKKVIGDVLNLPRPKDRDPGTIGCLCPAALRGGAIFRVHNVLAAQRALKAIAPLIDLNS